MPRTRSIRVLIVDDNRTVRRGLRIQLDQAEGIRVIGEAANGADAVAIGVAERLAAHRSGNTTLVRISAIVDA